MKREEIIMSLKRFKAGRGRKYRIRKIGFFGSAVWDRMNRESDIDVVVELEKQDLFTLIGIKQDLEEEFSEPVDVISYRDEMNGFLKNRIEKEAVYV